VVYTNQGLTALRVELGGEQRLFDVKPLLHKKPFTALEQAHVFAQAYVFAGTVNWPGQIDISPETLYDQSVPG
jgi:hypothetical protein